MLLAVALLRAAPVAAAVVGTGTPESCTEAALDAALAGGGVVTFDCGPDPVTITVTNTKTIAVDSAMDGGGLITISGGHAVGVFVVPSGVTFDARNLTIADGYSISGFGGGGGGIFNAGTLWLTNCALSGNSSTDGGGIFNGGAFPSTIGTLTLTNCRLSGNSAEYGGAIANGGTLTVINSTFSGNSADPQGGGIFNRAGGTLTVSNSTFSGNSATDSGGAIFSDSLSGLRIGTLTVSNSTFSGNSAANNGGAIENGGTLAVTNSTFSGNSATGRGGAIDTCGDSGDCPATIRNTIVTDSPQGGNCAGAITDGGHNLDDGTSCGFSTANGSLNDTDPKLDPAGVANNGARTQTIALEPDSPAINAGDPAVCANAPVNGVDQRGFVRPGIGHTACSIGACEANAVAPGPCTGDCNGNGVVAVNELILGVNIVLDQQPEVACAPFANSQERVDIAQLIAGVNNALNGCSGDPCQVVSGGAAATCASRYAAAIGACRNEADAACEAEIRADGGRLATLLADTEEPVRNKCTAAAADKLTFLLGVDDLVDRTAQACRKWGEDFVAVTYAADLTGSAPEVLACQRVVGAELAALNDEVVQAYGPGCYVAEFNGHPCDRSGRDSRIAQARTTAAAAIEPACGPAFDTLGLVPLTASPTLTGRIGALMDVVVDHGRHLAQRVYPPLDLGPTGLFGPSPVGVHHFDLVDPSRLNVAGTGPRPVTVELYYPSTLAAVTGVPRETIQEIGLDLFVTPTYRDVARAPGTLPLVLFSGGSGTDSWNYVYLAAHLASHGFLVAGVEHAGDRALHTGDAHNAVNRPLDLSFVLDQFLALNGESDSFLAGAIDPDRIGAAGHSAGGYTVMALDMCPFALGEFTDPRVKAILPFDPSAETFLTDQSPAIFSAITVPTLLVGGTLSRFAPVQPLVFDALEPGPIVTAFANLTDAVHTTFSGDQCEIPDDIVALTGPPLPECEPGSVPWRYARHITNYLALNFFDATLNENADALARLDPAMLSTKVEDFTYQSKAGGCPPGDSCTLTCAEAACGDGIVGPKEVCDRPGEQGVCGSNELCNTNCTACVACGDATVIDADGGVVVGTTVGGTTAFGGGSCGGANFAPERLFQWTPSVSHVATIQTCGGTTAFDTALSVRQGTCVGPEVACNDDAACAPQSKITLSVVAGTTYFIVVGGEVADAGNFTLSVL